MGLSIYSQSDKDFDYSYSALHYIRYVGYQSLGGERDYGEWHKTQRQEVEPDWEYAQCLLFYPNLYWHSDCSGVYTLRGKIDDTPTGALETGNSKQLLNELTRIKQRVQGRVDIDIQNITLLETLYELVKDVVENYNGRLKLG